MLKKKKIIVGLLVLATFTNLVPATVAIAQENATNTVQSTTKLANSIIKVTNIKLNKTSLDLEKGKTSTLTSTISPSNATNKEVKWTSSNPKVAKVVNGLITAIGSGFANITVTTVDGSKSAVCNVKVIDETKTLTLKAPHTNLYKTASFDAPLKFSNGAQVTLSPQKVTVIEQKGDWYCIKSSLGNAWLNIKTPIPPLTLKAPHTNLYKTASFDTPLKFSNGTQATLSPQKVTVIEQKGDWYCIKSSLGNAWLNIKTPIPPLTLKAPHTNLYKTASFDTPLKFSNGAQATLSPQKVTVIEQKGDWYCIKSSLGNAWLNIKTPVPPLTVKTMSSVLYGSTTISGKISCGFDGYRNTKGRHEGIDFAYGRGKLIYSLINGEVINVVQGSANSLSTIAIYDSVSDKTVIYLHSSPTIKKGDIVSIGTKLGYEDSRAGGSPHTHVEVRNGRRTSAAKSVGDYNLDNSNP